MFAYCGNNPATNADPDGHFILTCIIVGAIVGAVVGGCIGAVESKKQTGEVDPLAVVGGAIGGAIVGGLAGWGVGVAVETVVAVTAATPAVQEIAENTTTALQSYYPPNNGFAGEVEEITLETGTQLQRIGNLYGQFVSPAGTPPEMLSLPADKVGQAVTYLEVVKPMQALAGRVAPWFGQIGCGTQYFLNQPVNQLIISNTLRVIGETK